MQKFTIIISGKMYKISKNQIDFICGITKNQRINLGVDALK